MRGRTLNLGILAHVDAGKTTLTERLLHAAGVIRELGSVDKGTTQSDALALERQRGITIRSAVVSFAIGDLNVNLIDTPGHPDFIAEVERVLGVLDGAVLVLSAVEGVQPQSTVLLRTLRRLRVPTLLFVNKIDRGGAGEERVLREIAERLTPAIVPLATTCDLGTRAADAVPLRPADAGHRARLAEVLAEHDDAILAAYLDGAGGLSYRRLRRALAAQTARALVHPVLFGSALTGAGCAALADAVAELLPAAAGDVDGSLSARVFKIERGAAGEKIAYVRLFSGRVGLRDRLRLPAGRTRTVTAVGVFERGTRVVRRAAEAGEIAKLWGLHEAAVGDAVGTVRGADEPRFAPPTLETVVLPREPAEYGAVRTALAQLSEQDPLIGLRQDDVRRELSVSLYGEVQKEIVQATLAAEYGLDVSFRESTTICVERPAGVGEAVERMREPPNPFLAGIGLRIEPAAPGTGVEFRLEVELGSMPIAFFRAVEATLRATFSQGLCGWEVTDCLVTMTHCRYAPRQSHAHQGFSKAMSSTGEDFRKLTPLVAMAALRHAGTLVCEPVDRFRLDAPADVLGPLLPALARLEAVPLTTAVQGSSCTIEGEIRAARVHVLRLELPGLTRGEGVLERVFDRYEPVTGRPPVRPRVGDDPLDREAYLLQAAGRGPAPKTSLR